MWLTPFDDPGRPSHRARSPSPHVPHRSLVYENRLHVQRVEVDVRLLLPCISHSRIQQLCDDLRTCALRVRQNGLRLGSAAVAHEVGDDPRFTRRDANKPGLGFVSPSLSMAPYVAKKRCETLLDSTKSAPL